MNWLMVLLIAGGFAAGILLSAWQARRRARARMADIIARRVEKEMARRVMAELAGQTPESLKRDAGDSTKSG